MKPVRWSDLKWMARSPAHYRYNLETPTVATKAMRIGAYVHHLVLGGDRKYVTYDGTRRGTAWMQFEQDNFDAEILTVAEANEADAIAASVLSNKLVAEYLVGHKEVKVAWSIGDRDCSGTPDSYQDSMVVELKVTADASPYKFPFHARRNLWDAQLAWYANGLGIKNPALFIVAVEAKPPHIVAVYGLTGPAVTQAQAKWRGLFETLLVCEAADEWPGYCESVLPLDGGDELTLTIDGEEVES